MCSKQREMRGAQRFTTRSPHRTRQSGSVSEVGFQTWTGRAARPARPPSSVPADSGHCGHAASGIPACPPLSSVLNYLSPRRLGHPLRGHGSQRACRVPSPPADAGSQMPVTVWSWMLRATFSKEVKWEINKHRERAGVWNSPPPPAPDMRPECLPCVPGSHQ